MNVKVEIFRNRFVISGNGKYKEFLANPEFTSTRLLIGNFQAAEYCLKNGLEALGIKKSILSGKPVLHFYPREMIEGGLSEVENRILLEVGFAVGAKKVEIHV
ncbi:MAG: hypothetical protein R3F41_04990 [Gammaproteobacteria bacterium]|nr:hypothetical protein [Pseudomonadales bacterium]